MNYLTSLIRTDRLKLCISLAGSLMTRLITFALIRNFKTKKLVNKNGKIADVSTRGFIQHARTKTLSSILSENAKKKGSS